MIEQHYPIHDFGPAMPGLIIGGIGIFHVFLAQFAIGGGFLMCYFERESQRGNRDARLFLDSFFPFLVLLSFVAGAVSGVGMWITTIQVSPQTIGLMIDEFHWLWAVEWTFFALEIATGYLFYRYAHVLSGAVRIRLLALYALAAWGSLFWINGILSWQLTPGDWLESGSLWRGFFNASFWPSLLFRTVVAFTLAGLVACVVINTMDIDRERRAKLLTLAARFLLPMLAMPLLGAWFLFVIPEDSRAWLMGGSVAMSMFLAMSAGASVLIAAYVLVATLRKRLYMNGATATLLVALAFAATAAGEFVREGARKPFTVRGYLYSNAVAKSDIERLRREGSVTRDPYPLRDASAYPSEELRLGARVYRKQCAVCHSLEGVNGLRHLVGSWSLEQSRINIAQLQHTKAFMPPFAGTAVELEALVQMLHWTAADRPDAWPASTNADTLAEIEAWLHEAGTEPGELHRDVAGAREEAQP